MEVVLEWLQQGCAAMYKASLMLQLLMGEADEVEDVTVYAQGALGKISMLLHPEAEDQLEAIEEMVSNELSAILDELTSDCIEWRSVTRKRGACTLGVLARYAGERLGEHCEAVLNTLYKLCRDDDDTVAAVGFETSEIVGEAIPCAQWTARAVEDVTNSECTPAACAEYAYCSLVTGTYQESLRVSHLQVVSSLVATSAVEELMGTAPDLLSALQHPLCTFEATPLVHTQVNSASCTVSL